jgi:hypothetical protein
MKRVESQKWKNIQIFRNCIIGLLKSYETVTGATGEPKIIFTLNKNGSSLLWTE